MNAQILSLLLYLTGSCFFVAGTVVALVSAIKATP